MRTSGAEGGKCWRMMLESGRGTSPVVRKNKREIVVPVRVEGKVCFLMGGEVGADKDRLLRLLMSTVSRWIMRIGGDPRGWAELLGESCERDGVLECGAPIFLRTVARVDTITRWID